MPSYDTRTVAFVLSLTSKELDNLLSRHIKAEIAAGVQGVDRRIGADFVTQLALGLELRGLFGLSWGQALSVARELHHVPVMVSTTGVLSLEVDLSRLRAVLSERLNEASEIVVRPRRGRPPTRSS